MSNNKIVFLEQTKIPTHYYNILADMPEPMEPPLHPGTKQPAGPQDLAAIFPMELIKQEVSSERFIEIPDEGRDLYRLSRPIQRAATKQILRMPRHIIISKPVLKNWLRKPGQGNGAVPWQWHVNISVWSAKCSW